MAWFLYHWDLRHERGEQIFIDQEFKLELITINICVKAKRKNGLERTLKRVLTHNRFLLNLSNVDRKH